MRLFLLFLIVGLSVSGCYKTVYMNVQGDKTPATVKAVFEQQEGEYPFFHKASWQHFFLYGWIPGEKIIDASQLCGGAEHIVSINTQRTVLQSLVASVASVYYVNIYSPYDGHVVCDNVKMPEKSEPAKSDPPSSNAKPESNAKPDAAPPVP